MFPYTILITMAANLITEEKEENNAATGNPDSIELKNEMHP